MPEHDLRSTIRKLAIPIAFLAIGLPVGIGAVMAMGHDEESPSTESAFAPVSGRAAPHEDRRAQARWERVVTLTGEGSAQRSFAIARRAVQWRADWRCESGAFRMVVGRPSQSGTTLATSDCPDVGQETSTGTGEGRLQITASGAWRVAVKQQVDTPLIEPPLAGMRPSALLTRGRFHDVQKQGEGGVSLYRLASGRLALRFDDFYTSPSPGLRVWLTRAPDVKSTLQARRSKYLDAGAIRSTMGSFNQMLPAGANASELNTVVIWCPTVLIAFSAAPLRAR